jgi:hypothetical protein
MEVFPSRPQPSSRRGRRCVSYSLYLTRAGNYEVELITGPTLNVIPTRGLGIAVSLDDQPPQVVNVFTPETYKEQDFLGMAHYNNTANNARVLRFTVNVSAPGRHTLKITMVNPTVVVQKIIVHDSPLPNSYLGPLESNRVGGDR